MAALTIHNLDDDVKAKLRIRAAEHGRSIEAEIREILTDAVDEAQPQQGEQEITKSVSIGITAPSDSEAATTDVDDAQLRRFIDELPEIDNIATAFIRMGEIFGGIELDIPPRTQKARVPDFARSELDKDDERAAS